MLWRTTHDDNDDGVKEHGGATGNLRPPFYHLCCSWMNVKMIQVRCGWRKVGGSEAAPPWEGGEAPERKRGFRWWWQHLYIGRWGRNFREHGTGIRRQQDHHCCTPWNWRSIRKLSEVCGVRNTLGECKAEVRRAAELGAGKNWNPLLFD